MELIDNAQLVFIIQRLYPDLTPGQDFKVWRQFTRADFKEQFGDAMIWSWPPDRQPPTPQDLRAAWERGLKREYEKSCKAEIARWTRTKLFMKADSTIYRLEDMGKGEEAAAWRTYRQALRDVPQQPGFPDTINWPVEPGVTS